MANVADQFKAINAYFAGTQFLGKVHEFHPVELELETEPYRAGGMDGSIDLETGLELMTTELTIKGIHREIVQEFGTGNTGVHLQVRGGLEGYEPPLIVTPVVYDMTGLVKSISTETVQGRGEVPTMTVGMSLNYYKMTFGGEVITEIDVLNMERIVNGTDRLEDLRAAIGA